MLCAGRGWIIKEVGQQGSEKQFRNGEAYPEERFEICGM